MRHALDGQTAPSEDRLAPHARLGWAVLALSVVGVVAVAWWIRDCYVDDAFTGFQFLANFLAGRGFVFHAGNLPVEGVTNIGWLLVLAPVSALGEPTIAAKCFGLAFLVAALTLTMLLGKKLTRNHDESGLAIVPLLLLASSFDFVYFPLAGMETALLAVILLWMAWVALRRPSSLALPILGAAAFLVHPEAVVVYPIYVLLGSGSLFGRQTRVAGEAMQSDSGHTEIATLSPHRLAIGLSILVLLVGAITAVRYAYFHDVVPNTFHSKPSDPLQALENGVSLLWGRNTNVPYWLPGWLLLPILCFGVRSLRRSAPAAAQMLAAIAITGIVFAIYSKPDWTATARYFAPYLPATLLLFWAGVIELVRCLPKQQVRQAVRRAMLAGVAATLLVMAVFDAAAQVRTIDWFPGYVMTSTHLVQPANWARHNLPADAVIATRRIGVMSYYSGHTIFDYAYGLADRKVAKRVAEHGAWFDLPTDAALADLWRARAPDYVLEDGSIIDAICKAAGGTPDRFTIHGLNYRVIQRFPIGAVSEWVLAGRADEQSGAESMFAGSPPATLQRSHKRIAGKAAL